MTNDATAPYTKFRFSVQDYYLLRDVGILNATDQVELLDGEIVPMSPIQSPHAACVDWLTEWFIVHLHGKAIIRVQNPISLSDYSEPEPDLAIVKLQGRRYRDHHPRSKDVLILIEVADSLLKKDRDVKLPLYARAEVPEVWIVNLMDQVIEQFTLPKEGHYQKIGIFQKEDRINSGMVTDFLVADVFHAS